MSDKGRGIGKGFNASCVFRRDWFAIEIRIELLNPEQTVISPVSKV